MHLQCGSMAYHYTTMVLGVAMLNHMVKLFPKKEMLVLVSVLHTLANVLLFLCMHLQLMAAP